ncbi:DUF4912 domain-containing protein (plasmid) [Bacillus sp. 31A1R]|uniref:DUF4912 domain-containing protein n=1 Tax=Robertmurraya mangrovi TaxID=3098077 RepID=A0ABU5IV13_9BACI|nr:DUF4912 domain-containing protein [Bacillus sp. 31A1R]MDZ5470991.1 DUF4912 domain-containing protein [Bacillus sp. 31A1R]
MINEIIKLKRKGLSFRKIAEELNSTVGKVQYQWNKYAKVQAPTPIKTDFTPIRKAKTTATQPLTEQSTLRREGISAWLVSNNRLITFWDIPEAKKRLISFYFDKDYSCFLLALRIYDVTSIIFNGSNEHSYVETIVPENQKHWVFKDLKPNRSYCLEIGLKITESKFHPILRSNSLQTPRTSCEQVGSLEKDIHSFLEDTNSPPNWIEHVSTYSYYETESKGGLKA